jgi:hypothetical protein
MIGVALRRTESVEVPRVARADRIHALRHSLVERGVALAVGLQFGERGHLPEIAAADFVAGGARTLVDRFSERYLGVIDAERISRRRFGQDPTFDSQDVWNIERFGCRASADGGAEMIATNIQRRRRRRMSDS